MTFNPANHAAPGLQQLGFICMDCKWHASGHAQFARGKLQSHVQDTSHQVKAGEDV